VSSSQPRSASLRGEPCDRVSSSEARDDASWTGRAAVLARSAFRPERLTSTVTDASTAHQPGLSWVKLYEVRATDRRMCTYYYVVCDFVELLHRW